MPTNPVTNYERFNSSNVCIHSRSWNYRGCWTRLALQLILTESFGCHPLRTELTSKAMKQLPFFVAASHQGTCNGQFACLLPPLEVLAVFHTSSPESNSASPYPVKAIVVQYITIDS